MKKKLTFLMLLLAFVALALVSCQGGTGSRPTTPTTSTPVFEVVFVAGDGEILKTESVMLGQGATAPEVPNRTGYVFVGWDTDFSYVDCSITVTAVYARVWTVQFVDAQGNEIRTFSVVDGEASPAPNVNPYLEGYTFIGWDQDYSSVKSDMIVRPVYQAEGKCTVTFLGKDGEVLKTQSVFAGGNAMAPTAPSIPHFTFKGWDKEYTNVSEDITVNAIYEEDPKFTVSFYDHNGDLIGQDSVYAGGSATAPSLSLAPHFTFKGWDKPFSYVQGDLSVYAVVEEDAKFTVEFVDFDGSVLSSQTVYIGEDAVAPADPIREGYTFIGWDKGFSRVQSNVTVNALYRDNSKFSVIFKDRDGNILKAEDVALGQSATAPMAPAVDNYTFAGWDKDFSNVTEDMVVTATYTENAKYTVAFVDYNGNVLHSEVVYAGKSATAPANPSRENYSFVGWDKTYTNVQADLTVNAVYRENAKYTVTFVDYDGTVLKTETVYQGKAATAPNTPLHSDLEFTGWDKNFSNVQCDLIVVAKYNRYYTVQFVDENGNVIKTQSVKEGTSAAAPAAPVKDGYVFVGWDKAFDRVSADLTVVARYEIVKHNVIFSVVGGESPATQVVEHGNKASQPADPVREGFDFIEWRLGGKQYDFSIAVTEDITLVAYFKSNGQVPTITNDTLKIDPPELELWVGITLQLNIMPNGETVDFMANTSATFDFVSTDPEVVSIEDNGSFTAHALGSAEIYAVVTKGGTYVGSRGTYTANEGDIIGLCYMTVVETEEYYQKFLADPENQQITLGSTSESRIDKNDYLAYPAGGYGSANIALWYNGTEAVLTATADDNPNVMDDWSHWSAFAEQYGIPVTFMAYTASGYSNEGPLWQSIVQSGNAAVQTHGATHLNINQHHSTARIWNEFYYGRKHIRLVSGNDSLIIGYPYGANYEPISSMLFIAGRGTASLINSVETVNYNWLNSYSGFPNAQNAMNALLGDNASNGWFSVHCHNIDNDIQKMHSDFATMAPYIEAGRLWAATFSAASQYGQERDTAILTVLESGADVIRLSVTDQMNDILFYHPLSVRVKVDASWTGARAYQNGKEVKVQIVNKNGETYLMVDAVPDKGEVTVIRTQVNVMEQSDSAIRFEATDRLGTAQSMMATFPTAWSYAYANQNGVQIPAYVKDGLLYVTFDVNGGEVSIVPLNGQYDGMNSYPMTMIFGGYVAPDPGKSITIASAKELVMFSEYVNAGNSLAGITIELIADIDMNGVDYESAGHSFQYKGSSGYYFYRPFSGIFEGNYHKIYNLYIDKLACDAGVFGYVENAVIRNLHVEGNVSGIERVGGIAAYAKASLISKCTFTGTVKTNVVYKNTETGRFAGGIVGYLMNGTVVEHCKVYGDVTSIPCEHYNITTSNIGGIVGFMMVGTVNNCAVYGNVTAGQNSRYVGGIVGTVYGSDGETGLRTVSNCFASVSVTGDQYVGGLCGQLTTGAGARPIQIYNCSIVGNVSANDYAGGLGGFGYAPGGTSMTNCYSAVTVNAPASAVYVGTIMGGFQAESYGLKINGNYYVGSLNPDMPVAVLVKGNGTFTGNDVTDVAAALEGLNTKASATDGYAEWRLIDGIPSAYYKEIYTVTFLDKDGKVISSQNIIPGQAVTEPSVPVIRGFEFIGWDKAFDNITGNTVISAQYKQVAVYTVTFLGKDGEVLKTEEVNEGKSATAPEIPAIEGYRFEGWDTAFDNVQGNLTVKAQYTARPATSAADYTVMSWTFGGNDAVLVNGSYGKFNPSFKKAVEEANPDIIILSGVGAEKYTDAYFAVEGYSRWAYGSFNDFRYNGLGCAILYKTDKFMPAGEISYQVDTSYEGRNIKSFVMFPLQNEEGAIIPIVAAFLGKNHKETHREQLLSDIKNALGTDLAAAIIRICVESSTENNDFITGDIFNLEADENGYAFKSFGGVDMKKDGEHPSSSASTYYYSCFLTYSQKDATVTDINVVGITEDLEMYPNKTNYAGYITKAYTCIFGVPAIPGIADSDKN